MRWFSWLVEAFRRWTRKPRARRLSVYRPPSYDRPFRGRSLTVTFSWPPEGWQRNQPSKSAQISWFTFSFVSHVLLLGAMATLTMPSSVRQPFPPVLVHVLPSGNPIIAASPPEPVAAKPEPQQSLPAAAADLAELRQFQKSWTTRADRLESRLLELTEATAAQQQTIKQQHQQMEASQQEATRLAEEMEQRTAEEQKLTARLTEEVEQRTIEEQQLTERLAKEQEERARLEAEIAEQQRQYEQELRASREAHTRLIADLQTEIARKDVAIHEFADQLSITIVDRVLFPSGQATLTPEGMKVLKKVGQILARGVDRRIQIEGHTDNQDIGPELRKRFASNWELSTARATEVVRYLLAHTQIPPERLSAVGRADTVPVAPNTTEAGRQQNRRIEIILLPPDKLRRTG